MAQPSVTRSIDVNTATSGKNQRSEDLDTILQNLLKRVSVLEANPVIFAGGGGSGGVGGSIVPLIPSGGDDTSALNTAAAARQPIGAGTFKIYGKVTQPFFGAGSQNTILKCMSAGAGVQFGPDLGNNPIQNSGLFGQFAVDGNSLASSPVFLANTVNALYADVLIQSGLGDGLVIGGQNNTFIGVGSGGNQVDCVFDNGCGGNYLIKPEFHGGINTVHNIEFRQTLAPPAGAYPLPEYNFLIGGIAEFNNNGCVAYKAGSFNYFDLFNFFTNANSPLIEIVADATPHFNGRLYLRDCSWTGNGVQASGGPQVGIQVTSFFGDIPFVLEGNSVASGLSAFINLLINCTVYNTGNIDPYNMSSSQVFRGIAGVTPLWFNYPSDQVSLTPENGWTGNVSVERKLGRIFIDGAVNGAVATSTTIAHSQYKPGSQIILDGAIAGGASTNVTVNSDGSIVAATGSQIHFHGSMPLNTYG